MDSKVAFDWRKTQDFVLKFLGTVLWLLGQWNTSGYCTTNSESNSKSTHSINIQ